MMRRNFVHICRRKIRKIFNFGFEYTKFQTCSKSEKWNFFKNLGFVLVIVRNLFQNDIDALEKEL